ncbi:unnamed protein product [Acanthosepion pharaonis]|uniref:Kinetochore scaffold 1 n=1 Tax=Acanthosepion pharaonis TaxID=158019 RepID=A0A812EAN0_ACAPH|nr:unnamed protein product [Sepia pharaonis]
MDEDEENKGCYVRQRRSSILKLPLAGIDLNKQIKQEERNKKKRLSKRVSFAETLDVWEFNKESQSENSDKNAFRNKDDNDKEISGIDSLLTGEIKNPTHAIENISDPEDSDDEGKATTLNCSVLQSPEKDVIIQNVSAIANKENINSVVSSTININCDDVSPANQSMCSPPDLDNTPKKLDNKLFFQQLMQKIKISPSSSKDNSPVVKAAVCPSMSTKMFLDNLIQSTKDETSFSDGVFDSKENLSNIMDTSTSASVPNSPALDKSVYYIESSKPVDSTIYFNHNPDQTASMDFTICESQTTNMTTKPVADSTLLPITDTNSCNLLTSQLSSQDAKVKTAKNTSLKETTSDNFEKDSSIVYDLNFKVEDLSGIMNERSDILIENSHYESTIHVSQNQLSSSIVNNRPSFSTKSVDDVKSSILALSNISSSLCSRMLINMHLPTLEKNLSTVEVESIEELLLLIGIDKLENVTIDYRRSSVDLAPLGSESKTIGEKLLMSCLEQPTYQSILQTYDSLKADEHYLLKEFHNQKLLEDFQIALKKKEAFKSNDELKNELIEAFKKSRQLSQQKVKQRKSERYVNLCSLLKEKVVVLEEAKSQLDDISQKIHQQLESLDEVLETLNKEFDHLNTLPQLTDEDLEQYVQVKKYLDDADTIQMQEQKLSNQCCQLRDQEKTLKEEYSNLEMLHANLLKPLSLDTSSLVNNCQKLKIYSVLFPWKLWQLCDDQQKYNFWNDTFQFCIHTQAEHIKKAHFELDENWLSVVKDHPWLQIAHEMRLNVMQEKSFLECLQHVSQLPQLLHRIGYLLSNLQDLAKEIYTISLRKVITRKQSSILVTYCCSQLTKVQVCFQFDPSNYPTTTIRHQVNLHYGNVRCEDINRRLQRIKPGPQYLSRLVNAVQLESVSSPCFNTFFRLFFFLSLPPL